jgi:ComF family protein
MAEEGIDPSPSWLPKQGLRLARSAMAPLLDFALPPRCPGCGAITPEPHLFCLDCWSRLTFLGEPCCACCALPFEYQVEGEALCGACLADVPAFDRLRAAVAYGEIPARVAMRLKYGGRPGIAETLARLMERHLAIGDDPLLAPVPLHRWRLWSRGYNQAALIASALGRRRKLPVRLDLMERLKWTPPLRNMSPRQRRDAVSGAFRVTDKHAASVRGRCIVLVDDIFTSGATAGACARTLRRAGAARVEILCWARVVKPDAIRNLTAEA